MSNHYLSELSQNSTFEGQLCPVGRHPLREGQQIMICSDSETAFSLEGWREIEGNCPFCPVDKLKAQEPLPLLAEPRPPTNTAWLLVSDRHSFPIDQVNFNIGREDDNHLILSDSFVSQYHARIRQVGRAFYLFDLASSNGVWVNKQRINRLLLRDGDKIRVGITTLTFKQTSENGFSNVRYRGSTGDTQPLRKIFS